MTSTEPRPFASLPTPPHWPLLGHSLQIDKARFHQDLEAWVKTLGPVYRLRLGARRIMVVADHKLVQRVLRERPMGYRRSRRMDNVMAEMGLPPGLFNAEGAGWERQRRMVMAGFDPAHIKRYDAAMQRVAQRLVRRWRGASERGESIDLRADLMRYTVDVVAGLAFGYEVNTLEAEADVIQRHMDRIMPTIYRRVFARIPTWRWWPSRADRELTRHVAALRLAVHGLIDAARARLATDPMLRDQPANVLEAMIVAADREGSGIDDDTIEGNVVTLLLAGEDTTANTLAWLLYLLARNPETLARAQAEVQALALVERHGGDAVPSHEQLAGLDYLGACAHEAMRLKPVAPVLTFEPLAPAELGGVAIDPDVLVITMMRVESVSAKHLDEPLAFRPERWLAECSEAPSAKRFTLPFGGGPRICPGRYLALQEIKLALAAVLAHFDLVAVDATDGGEPDEHLAFTMAPTALTLRLHAR